ncbi:ComF family protein [Dictyobacter formicarum]|uniref:Amidophosphoribosyltransferase n=1 Tax=Dictyobacter formicarum TaxID=2778368 RepID=A0ABQ3VFY3_9CHLR|nr:ComF family protein [Dictyobacter formicarum]GHO84563.1 amidophosphoribosyltransferase [Dictyobacter formicarum]
MPGNIIQRSYQQLLDILFPPQCAQCKVSGAILCPRCIASISWFTPPLCHICGLPGAGTTLCARCQHQPLQLSGVRAPGSYQEPLRSCIRALKYQGNRRLSEPLGQLLAQAYHKYAMRADLVIPVPLHQEKLQQRGYNQSQLLAESCARQLQLPLSTTLIHRIHSAPAQVTLTAQQRRKNLQGAFRCTQNHTTQSLLNRRILIIDDVCTTGATLEACAAPLFAAGARAVWGLVLARPLSGVPTSTGKR